VVNLLYAYLEPKSFNKSRTDGQTTRKHNVRDSVAGPNSTTLLARGYVHYWKRRRRSLQM